MCNVYDYRKTFNTIEIWAAIQDLRNARIDMLYINVIENIYSKVSVNIQFHDNFKRLNCNGTYHKVMFYHRNISHWHWKISSKV